MSNCTDVILYNIRTDTYSQLGKPTLYSFYTLSATPSFSEGVHLRQALCDGVLEPSHSVSSAALLQRNDTCIVTVDQCASRGTTLTPRRYATHKKRKENSIEMATPSFSEGVRANYFPR